jgi:hypothetical protein
MNKQNIVPDFNMPNHANELSKAEDILEKLKCKFKSYEETKLISNKQYLTLYEETIRILDYIGQLSLSAFNIETKIEEQYFKQYKHLPELAKKLWYEHYEKIHHPYDLLKNRCFKLLDNYDELYLKIYKNVPPNWSPK